MMTLMTPCHQISVINISQGVINKGHLRHLIVLPYIKTALTIRFQNCKHVNLRTCHDLKKCHSKRRVMTPCVLSLVFNIKTSYDLRVMLVVLALEH